MSIKLNIMPICEDCGSFEPDVSKMEMQNLNEEFPRCNTEIRCEHEQRCRFIVQRGLAAAQEDTL